MSTIEDLRPAEAGRLVVARRWATRAGAAAMLTALAATGVPAVASAHEQAGQNAAHDWTAAGDSTSRAGTKRHRWAHHHRTTHRRHATGSVATWPFGTTGAGSDGAASTTTAPATGSSTATAPATGSSTPTAPTTGSSTTTPTTGGSTPSTPTAPSTTGTGKYAIPDYIVQCESGGNYKAVNTSNPARPAGAYQIITSTWLAYGGGKYAPTADQATPAQQDEIAAKIWNGGAGRSAWACA